MRLEVDDDFAGQRIDKFLAGIERIGSRARAEKLIELGLVMIDGRPRSRATASGRATWWRSPTQELAEPAPRTFEGTAPVPVLFEDDDVLVVDKPPGLVVHPAPGHRAATLVELLAGGGVNLAENEDPVHYRPGVVHRLDKDTSGVIMLAKNHLAQRQLQLALRERTAKREYLALVHGHTPSRAGRVEAPIGRDVRELDPTIDRHGLPAGGDHPLRRAGAAAHHDAAAHAARDGPHAPDPRAPGGDRPQRRGGQGLRERRRSSGSIASSCTRPS